MSEISATSSFSSLEEQTVLSDFESVESETSGGVTPDAVDSAPVEESHTIDDVPVESITITTHSNTSIDKDMLSESNQSKEDGAPEIPESPQELVYDNPEALPAQAPPQAPKTEPEAARIEIHSLIPLLELLPALQIDDGHLILSGEITKDDLQNVIEYAARVSEFTYPCNTSKDSEIAISPALYIWLAQCTKSPLFPSLHAIRLLSVSPDLCYIPLLFSDSLSLLEISGISLTAIHLVKSLLSVLPNEAPGIRQLVLRGPQQLSQTTLYPISKLKHLMRLELDNITTIEGTSFLESLGTLPLLEDLTVVARTPSPSMSASPCGITENVTGFLKLRSLSITGSFQLIHDLVILVSSQVLRSLDIHVELSVVEEHVCIQEIPELKNVEGIDALTEDIVSVKAEVARLKQMVDEAQKAVKEADEIRMDKRLAKRLKRLGGCVSEDQEMEVRKSLEGQTKGKRSKLQIETDATLKKALEKYTISMSHLSKLEVSHRARESSDISVATKADGLDRPHAFNQTINAVVWRWSTSLDHLALSIGNDALSSNAPKHLFDLTEPLLLQLEHLHTLESLHLEGWNLPLEPSFPLISILKGWSNMKHIRLPLFSGVSPVKLDVLHDIADSCPRLESLQLKLDISTLPQLPEDSGALFALRHGLRRLTVESPTGTVDRRAQKQIARYLNVLFPYLKTVACQASEGPVAETWNEVNELISLLRLVKEDDRARDAVETKET